MLSNFVQGVRENGISVSENRQSNFGAPVDSHALRVVQILMINRDQNSLGMSASSESGEARLYIWNIQISAAFWGGFHFLEIILRNAIHEHLAEQAQNSFWWETDIPIFDSERDYILEAISKATKKGDFLESEFVISQLHFAFWVGLLAKKYHSALWVNRLEMIFPNYHGDRRGLHAALDRLRKLRNRIAHHESIYSRDLAADFASLCSVIGYMDSDAAIFVKSLSKVHQVLSSKDAVLSGTAELSF